MWFSVYFVLGQSIVIGSSDFEWLFLNSSLGIRARLFCYVIHYSKLCWGFYVFLLECYYFVLNAIFHFLLLITISFLFLLLLSSTFLIVFLSPFYWIIISFMFWQTMFRVREVFLIHSTWNLNVLRLAAK